MSEEQDEFIADRTPMTRALARGHLMRTGHELRGYYVPAEGLPEEWNSKRLIRECCAET